MIDPNLVRSAGIPLPVTPKRAPSFILVVVILVTVLEPLVVFPVAVNVVLVNADNASYTPSYPAVVTPVISTCSPACIPCGPVVSTVAVVLDLVILSIVLNSWGSCPR